MLCYKLLQLGITGNMYKLINLCTVIVNIALKQKKESQSSFPPPLVLNRAVILALYVKFVPE